MRQFDYWGSWQDSLPALAEMLSTGIAQAFVDLPHAEPSAQMFAALTPELEAQIKERGGVELWVEGAARLPLTFGRLESGKYPGHYYVKGGGPYIPFLVAHEYEDRGEIVVGPGHITCPHSYYDPATGRDARVPSLLVETYERFVKILKSRCTRVGPARMWVGKRAARMCEDHLATIRSPGFYAVRKSRRPSSQRGRNR